MHNSRSKKIMLVVTESDWGGAQRFILALAPYLSHISEVELPKFDVVVVAGGKNRVLASLEKAGVKTIHVPSLVRDVFSPVHDAQAFFDLVRLFKKERPDIVQLHSTKAGFYGGFSARLAGVPRVIYRIGGWAFNEPLPAWRRRLYIWLEKTSARYKDVIVVNCKTDRELAIKLGIAQPEKIKVIYNGIDAAKLRFIERDAAREYLATKACTAGKNVKSEAGSWNSGTTAIGSIANLYKTKGIEHLIKAASQIQTSDYRLQFVVIGEGPERPRLEKLIKRYKLEDRFFLVGEIPNAAQYLKAFDIFVLPSVKEGFPWVILEAMAAQMPIVATRVGAIPEILEHENSALLVPPADPATLAGALARLITDYKLSKSLSATAHKNVANFSERAMLDQFRQLS